MFQACGFTTLSESSDQDTTVCEATNSDEEAQFLLTQLDSDIAADDYFNVDNDLLTSQVMTDENIVASVVPSQEEQSSSLLPTEEEDIDEPHPAVTTKEAQEALFIIRRYVHQQRKL